MVRAVPLIALALALLAAPGPARAGEGLEPDVPKAAAGTQCVRPADVMRRSHMVMLKHKRDLTVHEGDRQPEASLKECVSCHAVPGADGVPVTVADPKHFCRSCHDYAAVQIDCFECHASRPEAATATGAIADPEVAALAAWLGGEAR